MKSLTCVLSLLACAALAPAAEPGFLRTQGKEIVDPSGKAVYLRGTNLGNWMVPEGYMFLFDDGPQSGREIDTLLRELTGPDFTEEFWREWRARYVTEADIRWLASTGLNTLRVPIHHALFAEGAPGWALLDNVIGWAKKNGIWIIIDLHAAPGGQTGTNIDDSWGYPWLFESESSQVECVALWKRIAARYKDEATVAGYDLLNEPIPHFHNMPALNPKLEPFYRRAVAAIREVDPRHIVILEGAQWATNFTAFSKPFDSNVVYQFHKYWMPPVREQIKDYLEFREKHQVPVYMGESGENQDEWVGQFRKVLEADRVHWTFWPYKKMENRAGFVSVAPPAGWKAIVEYAKKKGGVGAIEKNAGTRPSPEESRRAFRELLENVDVRKVTVNRGYVEALGLRAAELPR